MRKKRLYYLHSDPILSSQVSTLKGVGGDVIICEGKLSSLLKNFISSFRAMIISSCLSIIATYVSSSLTTSSKTSPSSIAGRDGHLTLVLSSFYTRAEAAAMDVRGNVYPSPFPPLLAAVY